MDSIDNTNKNNIIYLYENIDNLNSFLFSNNVIQGLQDSSYYYKYAGLQH